jgi:hypothetical protein
MAANFVFDSQKMSDVPQGVRLRFLLACGLVLGHFEQPYNP